MQKKKIVSINGSVILAKGDGDFAMHDIVRIGDLKLLGEVIKIDQNTATIQVYENTTGLKIGEEVIGEEEALSLVLVWIWKKYGILCRQQRLGIKCN